jgi:hypothetical protein
LLSQRTSTVDFSRPKVTVIDIYLSGYMNGTCCEYPSRMIGAITDRDGSRRGTRRNREKLSATKLAGASHISGAV